MHMSVSLIAAVLLAVPAPSARAADDSRLADVRVQLKRFHQFQFAGYYAALVKGYFRLIVRDDPELESPHYLVDIGYMNPRRWRHIADESNATGLMARNVDTDSFIFKPREPHDWTWVLYVLLLSVVLVILVTIILAKFYTLNRSLQAEIRHRIALEEELQKRAVTDFGTGVLNRRGFLEAMETEFARSARNNTPLSLIELDLDHFKLINDKYGHAVGDQALSLVTDICRDVVRGIDVIGRVGGEEFMIALPDTNLEGAGAVARRILAVMQATPLLLETGDKLSITASFGVAMRKPGESISSLMSRADRAMYEAKELGRNRVSINRDDM